MKIDLKDIAMDVDYDSLCLLQNHLMHDVKRLSVEDFVSKYTQEINEYANNDYEYNLVVAILMKVEGNLCKLKPKKLERYVADPRIVMDYVLLGGNVDSEDMKEIQDTLDEYVDKYVYEFEKCGLLYFSFDEAC